MKKLWQRKWLVVAVAAVVFLSVGAVAWATTNGSPVSDTNQSVVADDTDVSGTTAAGAIEQECGSDCSGGVCAQGDCDCDQTARPGAALRKAFREKADQWAKRHEKLMEALRDDMTPADQALYDQLVQKAKEQREALQQAREDLAGTLKQLRDLADKYLDDQS